MIGETLKRLKEEGLMIKEDGTQFTNGKLTVYA